MKHAKKNLYQFFDYEGIAWVDFSTFIKMLIKIDDTSSTRGGISAEDDNF